MLCRKILPVVVTAYIAAQMAFASNSQIVENIPSPPAMLSGEALEPEITIRDSEKETVYEYRIEGKLVMLKVQPKGASAPYYFVDYDGDGELEYSADDPTAGMPINQWILLHW